MSNIVPLSEHQVQDSCVVIMDGKTTASQDFVAILSRGNGDTSIYYNTDALTLGMAIKLIAKEFVRTLAECTEDEQKQIKEILGDAFIFERFDKDEEH